MRGRESLLLLRYKEGEEWYWQGGQDGNGGNGA